MSEKTHNTWTHTVFNATGVRASSTPWLVAITLYRPKEAEHTVTVRAWRADKPQAPDTTWYSGIMPVQAFKGKSILDGACDVARKHGKVKVGTKISGLGKKGMRLFSWNLAAPLSFEKNSTGKRLRCTMSLTHAFKSTITLTYEGPWIAGDVNGAAQGAMWDAWNKDMEGFANINDCIGEEEAMDYMTQTVS
tara:strand:+ start:3097 stop:3672 length:576 start_codon:yes stop_codon:yes gene_type:complete